MTTDKQKEAMKRYFSTEKGKEANRRSTRNWELKNPEKAKEVKLKYFQSEKGKASKREANRRYREKMKQKKSTI